MCDVLGARFRIAWEFVVYQFVEIEQILRELGEFGGTKRTGRPTWKTSNPSYRFQRLARALQDG